MPRTFGDATVHQSHFDYAVKVDVPLPEHGGRPPTEIETKIGKQIAGNLVEDGATLQMGNDSHVHYYISNIISMCTFWQEYVILKGSKPGMDKE
jgi:hypothetical protein